MCNIDNQRYLQVLHLLNPACLVLLDSQFTNPSIHFQYQSTTIYFSSTEAQTRYHDSGYSRFSISFDSIRRSNIRVRVVPSRNSDNDVDNDQEGAFKIIRLAVAQEVAYHDNRKHQEHNHEDLKVQIHVFA